MVNVIMVMIITVVVTVVGGGGAYLLWLFTRPKAQTWRARVWELGDGVKERVVGDREANGLLRRKYRKGWDYPKV